MNHLSIIFQTFNFLVYILRYIFLVSLHILLFAFLLFNVFSKKVVYKIYK